MAGFGILFVLIVGLIILLTTIFWIWMLIDCLVSNRPAIEKVVWVLVILFLHVLGAIIYFFVGRQRTTY